MPRLTTFELNCKQCDIRFRAESDTATIAHLSELVTGWHQARHDHDPTHGRIDRDIQEAVDAWGPKSLGQRVAIENTMQARRDRGEHLNLGPCCDLHNRNCEPPSELCCGHCTEASHPNHPPGEQCVMELS